MTKANDVTRLTRDFRSRPKRSGVRKERTFTNVLIRNLLDHVSPATVLVARRHLTRDLICMDRWWEVLPPRLISSRRRWRWSNVQCLHGKTLVVFSQGWEGEADFPVRVTCGMICPLPDGRRTTVSASRPRVTSRGDSGLFSLASAKTKKGLLDSLHGPSPSIHFWSMAPFYAIGGARVAGKIDSNADIYILLQYLKEGCSLSVLELPQSVAQQLETSWWLQWR